MYRSNKGGRICLQNIHVEAPAKKENRRVFVYCQVKIKNVYLLDVQSSLSCQQISVQWRDDPMYKGGLSAHPGQWGLWDTQVQVSYLPRCQVGASATWWWVLSKVLGFFCIRGINNICPLYAVPVKSLYISLEVRINFNLFWLKVHGFVKINEILFRPHTFNI